MSDLVFGDIMMLFLASVGIVQLLILTDIRNTLRDMDYTICGYLHDLVYIKRGNREEVTTEN